MDKQGTFFWILGKLTITTLIMLLIGATIFWIFFEKKGVIYEFYGWNQETKYLIIITYFYLLSSFFLTMLSITYVLQSPTILETMTENPKIVIFTSLAIMSIVTALLEHVPYTKKEALLKNILWTLHSILMGPAFAYFGPYICTMTAIKMFWAFLFATIISLASPKNTYIEIKPHIYALYTAVTISSILCFLFNPPVNEIALLLLACNLCGGMVLYFGVFVTNTQYMLSKVTEDGYDPVYTAAVMYLSALNLFLRGAMFYVVELTDIPQEADCIK